MAVRELPGAWNFRDVADTATALRPGRLFRSSELSRLDDAGRATLRRLGITDVATCGRPGRLPAAVQDGFRTASTSTCCRSPTSPMMTPTTQRRTKPHSRGC